MPVSARFDAANVLGLIGVGEHFLVEAIMTIGSLAVVSTLVIVPVPEIIVEAGAMRVDAKNLLFVRIITLGVAMKVRERRLNLTIWASGNADLEIPLCGHTKPIAGLV
jgi:hypothetical protein